MTREPRRLNADMREPRAIRAREDRRLGQARPYNERTGEEQSARASSKENAARNPMLHPMSFEELTDEARDSSKEATLKNLYDETRSMNVLWRSMLRPAAGGYGGGGGAGCRLQGCACRARAAAAVALGRAAAELPAVGLAAEVAGGRGRRVLVAAEPLAERAAGARCRACRG